MTFFSFSFFFGGGGGVTTTFSFIPLSLIVPFQIFIPTPWKVTGNSKGWGIQKQQLLKEGMRRLYWNFRRGGRGGVFFIKRISAKKLALMSTSITIILTCLHIFLVVQAGRTGWFKGKDSTTILLLWEALTSTDKLLARL